MKHLMVMYDGGKNKNADDDVQLFKREEEEYALKVLSTYNAQKNDGKTVRKQMSLSKTYFCCPICHCCGLSACLVVVAGCLLDCLLLVLLVGSCLAALAVLACSLA